MSREIRKLKERVAGALARQNYQEALAACLSLRALEPKDDRTLLKLGELHERLGQRGEALAAFRELLDLYADDGRLVRAVSVAKMILQIDPEDRAAQKKLALLYARRGLPASAAVSSMREQVRHAADHAPEAAAAPAPEPEPPPPEPRPIELELAPSLDALAAAEDPFRADAQESLRRQVAAAELADLDLSEVDLAFVELAPEAGPRVPYTPLFSELAPEELHAVLSQVRVRRFQAGEGVVREGEDGSSVFVVSDGEVSVQVTRPNGTQAQVATLGEGEFFGEFGMFSDGKRHASVVAATPVELLEIRHTDLLEISARHQRMRRVLSEFYRVRALETALAASRLFGHLNAADRAAVVEMVSEERHLAESTVLQEGDDGSGLYLVKRGRLAVESRGLSDDPVRLAELAPGDFFGEISVMSGSPVTADVVTLEEVELLKLSRREVLSICERHPEVKKALERTGKHRLHESIDRLTDSGLV